jgi:hypothetical protein
VAIFDRAWRFPVANPQCYWAFRLPRPDKAEDNDNIFYRHENVQIWERLKRYDDKHGTGFALRFDVSEPEKAPQMRLVEAEWRAHEARQEPAMLIQRLMDELRRIPSETLIDSAAVLSENGRSCCGRKRARRCFMRLGRRLIQRVFSIPLADHIHAFSPDEDHLRNSLQLQQLPTSPPPSAGPCY